MSLATAATQTLLHPQRWPTSIWVLLLTGLAYAVGFLAYRPSFPRNAPKVVRGWPVLGTPRFFTDRGNFLAEGARSGRYGALFNATPRIDVAKNGTQAEEDSFGAKFNRNLVKLLRKELLDTRLPLLIKDTRDTMDELAARIGKTSTITNIASSKTEGISDPFEDMYRLVFKLTMRMVGCDEIAEDEDLLQRVLRIFEGIDGASTATKVMFPWMPTVGHLRRVYSGAQMYMILEKIIKERNDRGVPGSDALQYLMENGDSTVEMVAFIVGALFAGLINSGINAAYLLCFMATEARWYGEVQKEVDGVIARHRRSEEETAEQILGRLDMETWEAEFPMIDLGLKETIRHTITGCGFRYNGSGKDVAIGGSGEVVPNDSYVVYHFDTTHMDPGFFPEPLRWDPARYLPGREEDKKDPHAFIGWGAGRHPCLGMRFAKMEMAVTTALFVARFDYHLVDAKGNKMARVPEDSVDRNKHSASKPREKMFLKYSLRA
ncbi:hypothetical protein COL5a_009842 [Colletotrichum fioriniae]|uniref:uncharacterized protein n=1 Tax=Colletotrichum fioriniae TaxID=710243 RepID=UPI0023015FD5|nr:uncharacterized protein COL516b_010617 [Colletotrichum fioriniae]KAJ0297568.1 hypothetical protein COL516b_010617 [Colletotrichum fioriniae]KAJ0320213.1 hypothetical protein COL5a_009842 [Colletotrichum fioriniae]KAJ3940053.1 hypothetical protein N0V96_010053 [Colletotrichum fioriniae]